MTGLSFPISPSEGATYDAPNGMTYTYSGGVWQGLRSSLAIGAQAPGLPLGSAQIYGKACAAMVERQSVAAGATVTLLDHSGSAGVLTHMFLAWQCSDAATLDNAIVKIYVDGEVTPSVSIPLLYLFQWAYKPAFRSRYVGCDGLYNGNATGGYIYITAPFTTGIKVTVTSPVGATASATIWSIVSYSVGGTYNWGRYKRLRNAYAGTISSPVSVEPYAEQTLADVSGNGVLWGLNFILDSGQPNWSPLEGNICYFVDGEGTAAWKSSGTEDYFGGAFFFNGGTLTSDFFGLSYKNSTNFQMAAYRFHTLDPVPFDSSLRVSWVNGEVASGNPVTTPTAIGANIWYYTSS